MADSLVTETWVRPIKWSIFSFQHIPACLHSAIWTLQHYTRGHVKQWDRQRSAQLRETWRPPEGPLHIARATLEEGMASSAISWGHAPQGLKVFTALNTRSSSSTELANKSLLASRWIHKPRIHQYRWGSTQFLCNKTLLSLNREYCHGILQVIVLRHFPNIHKVTVNTGKEALEKMRYQKWSYLKRILRISMTEIKLKSKTETKIHSSEKLISTCPSNNTKKCKLPFLLVDN